MPHRKAVQINAILQCISTILQSNKKYAFKITSELIPKCILMTLQIFYEIQDEGKMELDVDQAFLINLAN